MIHSLKQIQGRGNLLGGPGEGGRLGGRAASRRIVLQQERHEFPVLLEQAGEFAVQRGILPVDAVLQVDAEAVEPGEAAGVPSGRADEGRSEARFADPSDDPGPVRERRNDLDGKVQAVADEQPLGFARGAGFGQRRVDAGPIEPV
jgi:hypothetical protein